MPRTPGGQTGGMELDHLGIEDLRPGVEPHADPITGALPGIRRDFVNAAPAAGRHDHRLAPEGDEATVNAVVAEGAHHPVAVLQQPGQCHFHMDLDAQLDDAILQAADHLQAGAITDMAQAPIRMGAKCPLQNPTVGRPVEDGPVGLQLVDAIR
jgi:hypothetical protein